MTAARPYMQLRIVELEELFQKSAGDPSTLFRLIQELKHREAPRAQALLARVQQAQSQGDLLGKINGVPAQPQEESEGAPANRVFPRTEDFRARGKTVADSSVNVTPTVARPAAKWTASTPAQLGDAARPAWPSVPSRVTPQAVISSASAVAAAPVGLTSPVPHPPPAGQSATAQPKPLPQISVEDACRILKVAAGDAWEKIETARQRVVLKSSPWSTQRLSATQVQLLLDDAKRANDAAIVIAARRIGRQ